MSVFILDSPIVPKTMSGKEMHQLALAFRTFALNPGYRSTLAVSLPLSIKQHFVG
jgi:hypothetical protein